MIFDTPIEIKNKIGLGEYDYFEPSNYIPTIKPTDYEYGYISRYFVGRINYPNVLETNAKDFNMINDGFYKKLKSHGRYPAQNLISIMVRCYCQQAL